MEITKDFIRLQLSLYNALSCDTDLGAVRAAQDKVGSLMRLISRRSELKVFDFGAFKAGMVGKDAGGQGKILLYLHGGGFVSGDMDYCRGVGEMLAQQLGCPVFFPAYRLAPEHKYPAQIEDCLFCYRYLTETLGYRASDITLVGESAGGALCVALAMKLRELSIAQVGGLVVVSAWTDLTASSRSYEINRECDPALSKEKLKFYSSMYLPAEKDPRDPYVSVLFGDHNGLPPTQIFVGADEILLDDSISLSRSLGKAGVANSLTVREGMWHAYILYNLKECKEDLKRIKEFVHKGKL